MVNPCCVPGCTSNRRLRGMQTEKKSSFKFPNRNHQNFGYWIGILKLDPNKITVNSRVCENHFLSDDIIRSCSIYDSNTNTLQTVVNQKVQLKADALPISGDEDVEEVTVLDDELVMEVNNVDIDTINNECMETDEDVFENLNDVSSCVQNIALPEGWSYVITKKNISFGNFENAPIVPRWLIIDENLNAKFYRDKVLIESKESRRINTAADLQATLQSFSEKVVESDESFVSDSVNYIIELLKTVSSSLVSIDSNKNKMIDFIQEQCSLFICNRFRYRYGSTLLIFACLLFTISPHAYNFTRNSNLFILPHPQTIKKICCNLKCSPLDEDENENFLSYLRERFKSLSENDKTVSLMMDEIHVKPFMDYKAGNIVGNVPNSNELAKTAYVFMLNSLKSQFKEVAYILPAKAIKAEELFEILRKVILKLHEIGFNVLCVTSDNNSVNSKAMSFFSDPPVLKTVYTHPSPNASIPLFYVSDTVHILKNIRNNWMNIENQTFIYPGFEGNAVDEHFSANFGHLKELYASEDKRKLLKVSYGLTAKAVSPTTTERQNVQFVLKVFNEFTWNALISAGEKLRSGDFLSTAQFIRIILDWWRVVNVKTIYKGIRHRNPLENPLTLDGENYAYLLKFYGWLLRWKETASLYQSKCSLTRETSTAIAHSTLAIIQMTQYVINNLNFEFFLPAKVQTDALEEHFGKYRTMAGRHYLISLRQIYETEKKLRLQDVLPRARELKSAEFGNLNIDINLNDIANVPIAGAVNFLTDDRFDELNNEFNIDYNLDAFFDEVDDLMPVFTYIGGVCVRGVMNRNIGCDECRKFLIVDKDESLINMDDPRTSMIRNLDRGGLIYPHSDVIVAILLLYALVQQLISEENERKFLSLKNQKEVVVSLMMKTIDTEMSFLEECSCQEHVPKILHCISTIATNIFLNNYVKSVSDKYSSLPSGKNRKLATLTG